MKKKLLAITLISALMLSCSAFVIGLMPEKAMAAEGDPPAADPPAVSFEVIGASIRKIAPMGLRFEVKINADAANAATEFGMYLCPTELLTNGKFSDEQLENNVMDDNAEHASDDKYIKKVPIGADKLIPDPDNGNNRILRLSLVNLVPSSLDKQFSAMAYIKIGENVEKSGTIERSVAYVAREAKADPESGLEGDSVTFVDKIIADSNELAVIGSAVDMAEENRHSGQFSKKITLSETTTELKLRVNYKKMEGADKCSLEMYAKAVNDVTIGGQTVSKDGFTKLHFENLPLVNQELTLSLAGTGDLWIDDIKYTRISNADGTAVDIGGENVTRLGVDRLKVLGCTEEGDASKIRGTTMTKDETTGYMVYSGDTTAGTSHSRFYIENETDLPEDVYLAFKFRISDDTHVEDMRKGDSYEGLWMQAWLGENNNYMQIFDEEGNDWSIYKEQWDKGDIGLSDVADFTSTYGSLNRSGYDMKRNTWYYAVTCYKGVNKSHEDRWTSVYSCFYTPFEITFADVYTLTEEAKNAIFKRNMRAPGVTVKEKLSIEAGRDANINPRKYGTNEDMTCTSSDEGIATVDNAGNVHGVKAGTCIITVSAGGYSSTCAVTVTPQPPTLELHKENIKEIALNRITHDPVSMKDTIDLLIDEKSGYLTYKNKPGKGNAATTTKGGFKIINEDDNLTADDYRIVAEDYIVFVLKYSDDTSKINGNYTGVWFGDWQNSKGTNGAYNYTYTCLDTEFKDCSGDGVNSGTFADKTSAETWYYAVSPTAGHHVNNAPCDNYYGVYYENFNLTIAHVYAVSKEIRDALVGGYYEKDIISADKKLVLDLGAEKTLNAEVKQLGDTAYTLTYSSNDESVATVTDVGVVEAVGTGNCTITISAGDLDPVSCAIEVINTNPPCDISAVAGVTVINAPEGTPLLILDNQEGNCGNIGQNKNTGYWHYWTNDTTDNGNNKLSLANVNVPDDEYLVLQCKFAVGTVLKTTGLWPETIITGNNEERYYAVFDEDGYDYTSYLNGNINVPYGTKELEANKWYFFVEAVRGNLGKFGSYYAPFDFTIANLYSVTQAARDRLFNVNIHKGDTVPEPALEVESQFSIGTNICCKQEVARLLYAGKGAPALTYVSSNEAIASVDEHGFINAKAAGTCTITVSAVLSDKTLTGTCAVTVVAPRDISTVTGVRVLGDTDADPLLVMDDTINSTDATITNGSDATIEKDASGYWVYRYKGNETGVAFAFDTTQIKVNASINDGSESENDKEFIVYQVMYTRTTVSSNDGCSYPTMLDGERQVYLKGYDSEGNSLGDNVTPPGPGLWHFLVLPEAGNKTACLSYYPEFEYYISDVYAVTQEGLNNLLAYCKNPAGATAS